MHKNGVLSTILAPLLALIALCACATAPQKHALSDASALAIGKTTPAECRAIFGEPAETDTKTGVSGRVEVYRYGDAGERWGKACLRMLMIEFKEGKLNGYAFVSSYPEDHTSYAQTNLTQVEWAVSTKEEVTRLLGTPHGRFVCPTTLFAGECKMTGREIWVYAKIDPIPLLIGKASRFSLPIEATTVTFDEHGLVIDITKKQGLGVGS